MASDWPGSRIPAWTQAEGMPQTENPSVANVALSFGRLRTVGDYLAVNDGECIPGRKYTDTQLGGGEARMHMQGIQRMGPPNDDILLLTGGDAVDHVSHLFVCRMGSRPKGRAWGTNLRFSRKPPDADQMQSVYALDTQLWHAGGMSLLGDLLALPLEDDATTRSRVMFIDMTDPFEPRALPEPCRIERTGAKAGAVALTRLPNHYFLCAVYSDSDPAPLPRRIDFYLSVSPDLTDGFQATSLRWEQARLLPAGGAQAAWQNLNFVTQTDGQLFLIGTENTSGTAPYVAGDNRVELLHVQFPLATTHEPQPTLAMPTITRLAEKVVTCERDFANLDAAGGIYLARDWKGPEPEPEGRIFLYGAYHWRVSRCVRFIEFCGDHPASAPVITDIEDGWVDLYEHPDFRGQRLTIAGTADAEIPDYGAIQVQDCGFSDRVSSVRYQLPAGTTYRLYRDDKFHPQRGSVGLVGDGLVHEIRDLNAELGFDNAASSSKYD